MNFHKGINIRGSYTKSPMRKAAVIALITMSAAVGQTNVSYPVLGSKSQITSSAQALTKITLQEVKIQQAKSLGQKRSGSVEDIVKAELDQMLKSVGCDVRIDGIDKDKLGNSHIRLTQFCAGMEVHGGNLVVHVDSKGNIYGVGGKLMRTKAATNYVALIGDKEIRRIARDEVRQYDAPAKVTEVNQVIYQGRPSYEVTLNGGIKLPTIWKVFIDAENGEILYGYNNVQHAGPSTVGTYEPVQGALLEGEGGGTATYNGWNDDNGQFYLYSHEKLWGVMNEDTRDWEQRSTGDWGTSDRSAFSLGNNMSIVQDYVSNVLGRNSFDNQGAFCEAVVHVGTDYVNAYWDGRKLSFGDGDGIVANALTVLDITGHEFGHAITTYTSNLEYSYESGALNEAYSDIIGTLIEFHAQPDGRADYPLGTPGTADYLCGEDCWLQGEALRDLRDPGRFNQPSKYLGTYWYAGSGDNGGVHTNSGVANFAFYLLAEGGVGNNDGTAYDITGLGIEKSGEIAMYANMFLHTANDTYADAREHWMTAAGTLGYDTSAVSAVWTACGVRAPIKMIESPDDSIAFGNIGFGTADTLSLTLTNGGNRVTTISALSVDDTLFSLLAPQLPLAVEAGGSLTLPVVYTPAAEGMNSGLISITSNASDNPTLEIPVSGNAVEPASVEISDSAFSFTLDLGDSASSILSLVNNGVADLKYLLNANDVTVASFKAAGNKAYDESYFLPMVKGAADQRIGNSVQSAVGGPDLFGYTWKDSDAPGGPAYIWNDISVSGSKLTAVSGCDDCSEEQAISFAFPFYGTDYNSIFVSSNGYVTLGTGSSSFANYPIPDTGNPLNLVGGLMTDLNPRSSGDIYFQDFGTYAVVQYEAVVPYGDGGGSMTYQIVMDKSGKISFYYNNMSAPVNYATVGIQNSDATDGLQVVFNSDFVHNSHAVVISSAPDWFTLSSENGLIVEDDTAGIEISVNSAGLDAGTYNGEIVLTHNAVNIPSPVVIPVNLVVNEVAGLPVLVSEPQSISTYAGETVSFSVAANGAGLEYQWFKDSTAIDGATDSVLTVVAAAEDNGARFNCSISNSVGTVVSGYAELTLLSGVITVERDTTNNVISDTLRFVNTDVDSVTLDTTVTTIDSLIVFDDMIIRTDSLSDSVIFSTVYDTVSTVTCSELGRSTEVYLHLPTITSQPADISVNAGDAVLFAVAANGTDITYQWQKDGADIDGAVSAEYSFTAAEADNGARFTCIVSNSAGDVTSSEAVLTVVTPQYQAWDANQPWYDYSVGDLRTNGGKLWRCINQGFSYIEPSSASGGFGWEFVSDL